MFLFFIATIPFEQIGVSTLPVSPARLAGVLFLGCCLWYPKTCFPRPAPAVLWFTGYLVVLLIRGLFIPAEIRGQLPDALQSRAQLILFFWVGSSLFQDTHLARQSVFVFGAATAGVAFGTLARLPGFAVKVHTGEFRGAERSTAFGYNPNTLAVVIAVAVVMLVGLLLDNTKRRRSRTWLLAGMNAPLLLLLVATGSRGGLIALVLGLSLFLVPLAPSRRRLAALALGLFALLALGAMVARNPLLMTRLTRTYKEGNVAGRDTVFLQGAQMFLEQPVVGWGPVDFLYELGSRLNRPTRDPHNMLLWLLLEGGVVGSVFFLSGFWLCLRAAWKSRTGPEGILPLALLVVIIGASFSGSWLVRKPLWLVFGIAIASPALRGRWQPAVAARNRNSKQGVQTLAPGFRWSQ